MSPFSWNSSLYSEAWEIISGWPDGTCRVRMEENTSLVHVVNVTWCKSTHDIWQFLITISYCYFQDICFLHKCICMNAISCFARKLTSQPFEALKSVLSSCSVNKLALCNIGPRESLNHLHVAEFSPSIYLQYIQQSGPICVSPKASINSCFHF